MVKNIVVKRVRHGISFIPAHYVNELADGVNIISIITEGSRRPLFKPNQNVLCLTDELFGLTIEDHQKAKEFFESLNGANLFIHCEMGQRRSHNLAKWLRNINQRYRIAVHSTDFVLN